MHKSSSNNGDRIYRLAPQVVLEVFDDGALILRLADRHLLELNLTASRILEFTDGTRNVNQVAELLAQAFEISPREALADTLELYEQMSAQGVVEMVDSTVTLPPDPATTLAVRYARNPDVVLREEDEDGGLLFNPDTNQVRVLNTTGLFIWKQCDGSRDLDQIARALQESFEDAPSDQVNQDVREFVEEMVASGFIGTVG